MTLTCTLASNLMTMFSVLASTKAASQAFKLLPLGGRWSAMTQVSCTRSSAGLGSFTSKRAGFRTQPAWTSRDLAYGDISGSSRMALSDSPDMLPSRCPPGQILLRVLVSSVGKTDGTGRYVEAPSGADEHDPSEGDGPEQQDRTRESESLR